MRAPFRLFHTYPDVLALVLLALVAWGAPAQGREPAAPLEILAFEYPPIYHDGNPRGLACELAAAAFDASGIAVTWRFLPVKRMIASLAKGEAACALGGTVLFKEDKVASRIRVSQPLHYVLQVFLYDTRRIAGELDWNTLEDLAGYRIGVLDGSGVHRFLKAQEGLTFVANSIHGGSARQLRAGRIDLWAIVDLTGRMHMADLYPDETAWYAVSRHYERGDVSVVFSKERDSKGTLEALFLEGLEEIKSDGTYMDIMARYYGGAENIAPQALADDIQLHVYP